MADFAKVLRLLRNEKGLSQQELAELLRISKSSINMYERGERQPNFETLEIIADFFNVDVDYLLGRTTKTTKVIHPVQQPEGSWYLDDEARDMAQFMLDNPEYRVLFDASRKVRKDDIEFVKQMLDRFKEDD
ncbi:MAG: helix-turn-helix transcriptional regulator [Lachnospiraceae bacterium]|nr:helix-turn-helix transcriptional regulator [Lachnospiraceae bacterium]